MTATSSRTSCRSSSRRSSSKKMSKEAKERCLKELKKLKMMRPMSAEATVVRNYIDWVLALPWEDKGTDDKTDHREAEKILDEDHYGLEKAKERILEYLAVQTLVEEDHGPILCLVGPPGVGKTSLARSIARATGRKFVRAVARRRPRRGRDPRPPPHVHRRDARQDHPGRCARSGRTTRSSCSTRSTRCRWTSGATRRPRCSRSSTPSRTTAFNDHYLDLDYDLSDVMFIARPTPCTRSRCRCRTAWRSSSCPATPSRRSSRSPAST